jgi:hypothetical protein
MENAWILEDEHYLATILHPRLKHFQTGALGDRERAVQLLKTTIQQQVTSSTVSSSHPSHQINGSSSRILHSGNATVHERKNVLARCFDQVSSPLPSYLRECDEYLNSVTATDGNETDSDDSKLLIPSLSLTS